MKASVMIYKTKAFFLFIFLIYVTPFFGQSAGIFIDEQYNDWNSNLSTYTDGFDNAQGIDLLNFQVTNDETHLFVKVELNQDIDITDNIIPHDLWFHIDADNNPTTGYNTQTGYGTELSIRFGQRYAWFNIPSPSEQVNFGAIGLVIAPTVTSSVFEFSIPRDILPNGVDSVFTNDTIRLLFTEDQDGDAMPNVGAVYKYTFDTTSVSSFVPISIKKEQPDLIRIVTYNTLSNSGWAGSNKLSNLESVVTALDADIYCFQECSGLTANEVVNYLNTWLPLATSSGWSAVKYQDLITCSKWSIMQSWTLNRQMATLINLPSSYSKNLLAVNAHLSCCAKDANRQAQIDEFASFILDAKNLGGVITLDSLTPIVMVGDMNFVGYAQQPITMLSGDIQDQVSFGPGGPLDWDNTDLKDTYAPHADQRMVYTWRNRNGVGYPPGRLDYQAYTDAALVLKKSFVLQTEVMDSARLSLYNLDSIDTYLASDHLPVTADYTFPSTISSSENVEIKDIPTVYPNPTEGLVRIETCVTINNVAVRSLLGKTFPVSLNSNNELNLSELPNGLYFLEIVVGQTIFIEKINVIH